MLVIGCGNMERGDDGAGLVAARRLQELGVPAVECSGECLGLIDLWPGERRVALIDAAAPCGHPGQLHAWDGVHERLPRGIFPCSTHRFGVAEAVELARILGRLPDRLDVYGIEAATFQPGAPLTPAVVEAVERLAQALAAHRSPLAATK